MNAHADTPQTVLVPLADCYVHPLNTRSEPDAADIEALAQSIDAIGLLQNLLGWIDPSSDAEDAWKTGIVAGGRRLRAVALLAERQGRDPAETRIPVQLAPDEDTARLWASAENEARTALHPADEVRAYARMEKQGADINAIARAFARTERHVRQRLKLAALPDTALAALREGRISLDQAAALTTGRTSSVIEYELEAVLAARWTVTADQIRRNLTADAVRLDDRRVKFVTLDAYRAAGGTVIEDLFSDATRIEDEHLLNDLVAEKLAAAVQAELDTGRWFSVQSCGAGDRYDLSRGMILLSRRPVDLPEGDARELDDLQARAEIEELTPDDLARMDALEERAAGDFDPDEAARATVWIYIDYDGDLVRHGPYLPPAGSDTRDADAEGDDPDASAPKPESRALPQNLRDDLARIRLAALQTRAARKSELMLDLLAFSLTGAMSPWAQPLAVTASNQNVTPEKPEGFEPPALFDDPQRGHGPADPAAFEAFRAQGAKHRNEVLTRALARALTDGFGPTLAAQLAPNPREIWTPTKTGYLSRLPVPALDDLWSDMVPEDRRDTIPFADLKKGEKADLLHKLFNDLDFREALQLDRETNARIDAWLPDDLTWPEDGPDAQA